MWRKQCWVKTETLWRPSSMWPQLPVLNYFEKLDKTTYYRSTSFSLWTSSVYREEILRNTEGFPFLKALEIGPKLYIMFGINMCLYIMAPSLSIFSGGLGSRLSDQSCLPSHHHPYCPSPDLRWVISFQNSDSNHQNWELSVTKGLFSQFSGNIMYKFTTSGTSS